jgi:hypothetical protein
MVALICAGCSDAPSEDGDTAAPTGSTKTTPRSKAMKFAACMRENGVSAFPDPDASGELTVDAIANGTSVDTSTAAFENAMRACKDLEPSGFTGRTRSEQQQETALEFAQCMRDNGIKDFPDPTRDGPLIDTTRIPSAAGRGALSIPGFTAAQEKCGVIFGGKLGLRGR